MATPAFTGVDYLSALSEFPGGPQGLIDAAVERFGAQGLTATPRGDDFSLYVPGEFMSSGRPMNYASVLANPTVGGGYYDYLYSTPAFKDIYTNILSPTLTGLQPQAVAPQPVESVEFQTRPIAKAGGGLVGGATGSPADTQLPGLQVTPPVGQTVTETPKKQLELPQITESVSGLQGTPAVTPVAPTAPTPIDTRTPEEIQIDKGLDIYNKLLGSDLTGKTYFERPTYPERDPYAAGAVDTRPLGIYRTGEPTRGLVLDMPLTSRYPDSTGQQYLQGGLDAFAFSGPQGYADVRQQLLGEPADAFTGPEVDWQNLGKPAPVRDIYLGTEFPDISVDDILANIPKIDLSDYNAAKDRRLREFIADIPDEAFWQNPDPWEFSDETMSNGLRGAIADLVSDRATEAGDTVFVEAREGIEGTKDPFDYVRDDVSVLEQWLGVRFTDAEKQAMTGAGDAEDFRFYEHPGVRKKFSDGLDNLKEAADNWRKGLFGETPYGPAEQKKSLLDRVTENVKKLGNTIAELNSEISTLIELEGDTRKSIGTYDPKFPTLKGLLQLATGQGLSEVDKQKYGSLNVGALATLATIAATAPQATAAVLGLQITNTLRKIAPQILNVATFKEADYSGGLFSDVVEFSGEVLRPIGRFFVENIFQKINENAPDDANLRTQFESLFEGDKPQTFAEYLEPEATVVVNPPDFPSVGQITPPGTGVPFSASPASGQTVTGQVTSRPGPELPIRSSDPNKQGEVIDYTSPFTGQGVSAGPAPVVGSSLPGVTSSVVEPTLVDPITLDITPPVTESPFTGMGVSSGASSVRPRVNLEDIPYTDAFGRDIATLGTEFEFVPEVDSRPRLGATTGTTPFGGLTRAFTPLTAEAAELAVMPENVPDPSTLGKIADIPTDLGDGETVDIEIQDDLFKPSVDVKNYPGTDTPSESSPTEDRSDDWNTVLENLPEDVKEVRTIPMKEFEFDAEGRLIETGRVLNVPQRLELVASENADGSVTYGYRYQDYDQAIVNYLIEAKQTNVVDANVNYSSHVRKDGELIGYDAKAGDKVYTIPEDLDYENYKPVEMPSGETPSDFVEPPYLSVDEINTQATELSSNLTKAAKDTLGDVLDIWPKNTGAGTLNVNQIKGYYDEFIAAEKSPAEALSLTLALSLQYAPKEIKSGNKYTKEFTDELEEKLSGSFSDVMYGTRELDNLNIGAIANFNYQPVVINAALRNLKLPEFDFGDKLNIVSRLKDYQPGGYQRIADNVGLDNPFKIPDLNIQIDSGGGVQIIAPGP